MTVPVLSLRLRLAVALVLLAAGAALAMPAQTAQADPEGIEVLAGISTGAYSYTSNVAVNPTTNRVYVSLQSGKAVSVIDGASNTVITDVSLGREPEAIAVNPVTNLIYAGSFDSLAVIDGANSSVVATIAIAGRHNGIGINTNTNRIYVSSGLANTVSVINGDTNAVLATVPVGVTPSGVAVNQNTNRVYVSNYESSTVSVIDGATNTVVSTIQVQDKPAFAAVNPNTNRVYVDHQTPVNSLSVISGATNAVVATIPVIGKWGYADLPRGIGVNTATNRVWVAADLAGMAIFDGTTNTQVGVLDLGGAQDSSYGVTVNSSTNRVYVGTSNGDRVVVIADGTPGPRRVRSLPAGLKLTLPDLVTDISVLGQTVDGFTLLQDSQGSVVARFAITFGSLITDVHFLPGITAESDRLNGKAALSRGGYAYPLGVGQRDLYVPKLVGHNQVRVCPNAQGLAQVGPNCDQGFVLAPGQTHASGVRLASTTAMVGGQEYWVVENAVGTGAQGETAATTTPTTAPTAAPTTSSASTDGPVSRGIGRSVPDPATWTLILSGLAAFGLYAALSRRRRGA